MPRIVTQKILEMLDPVSLVRASRKTMVLNACEWIVDGFLFLRGLPFLAPTDRVRAPLATSFIPPPLASVALGVLGADREEEEH